MTALFSCDMGIYSKGRLVIQNNNPKKKKQRRRFFSHRNNNKFCVNATHVRVSPESVWVN